MTGMQIGLILLVSLYFVVGVGTYFLVKGSGKRFIIAGKRLPLMVIGTMLLAQALDANATLGAAAGTYSWGFWAGFVFPLGLALCLLITGIWYAKPLNRMNLITLPDFYFRRFGKLVEVIVSFLMAFSFIILVAGNMAGAAWIISIIFGISYLTALIIMSTIVLIYTFSGGLFSCASTDVVQIYPALVAFAGSAVWMVYTYGWSHFSGSIPAGFLDMSGLISIENGALLNWAGILALGLGDIVALDFMERIFASKNPETAQKGCFFGAGFTLIAGLGASFLGLMAITLFPDVADPRTILPLMATITLPFLLGLFVMGGVLGAGMSTANGGLLGVSAVFGRNLLQRNLLPALHRRKANRLKVPIEELTIDWHIMDKRLLGYARFMTIPVMVAAVYLAIIKPEPGIMLVLAFDVVFAGCLVPLTLGLFWKKANSYGALAAVVVGSVLRLILFFTIPEHLAGLDTLIPPVVSLMVMVPVSLMTQKQDPPKHEVINEIPSDEDVARAIR
ncbi:MAG: hypothetical protein V3R36_00990 [Dehalococcoidales bacterium]